MAELLLLLRLFFEFFKTGLFSVGGGLATIPFLTDMSERTGWFTKIELADMIAVAESTPGPVGVNTATYVGYKVAGIPGGIVTTLGLVMPSLIVIIIVAYFLGRFRESKYVKNVFYLLRPASLALIFSAGISFILLTFFKEDMPLSLSTLNIAAVIIAAVIFVLMQFFGPLKKLHPIVWIGISAVCGIVFL